MNFLSNVKRHPVFNSWLLGSLGIILIRRSFHNDICYSALSQFWLPRQSFIIVGVACCHHRSLLPWQSFYYACLCTVTISTCFSPCFSVFFSGFSPHTTPAEGVCVSGAAPSGTPVLYHAETRWWELRGLLHSLPGVPGWTDPTTERKTCQQNPSWICGLWS